MSETQQNRNALPEFTRLAELARQVLEKAFVHNVFGLAGQLAFFFLLAIFPFLLLLATLLPYLTDPDALESLMAMLRPVVPPRSWTLVQGNVHTLLIEKREGLLSLSAVALSWSSSSGFVAVMEGLNVAYGVRETRPFWKVRLMAIGFTLVLGLMLTISIVLLVFGERLSILAEQHLAFPMIFWWILRWVAGLAFLILALDIVYHVAPNVRHRLRWLSSGAVAAALAWVVMSLGLRLYIPRFTRYEATYGALTAVISMMLWFYLSSTILLVGGELNSTLEQSESSAAEAAEPETAEAAS